MEHTTNLTSGNIKFQLSALMLPLLVGSILQQLYNAIDAFIIGRFIDQTAFAAVGVAGTIMNLFIFILSGCCAGISIIFAQFYGADNLPEFRKESFLATTFGGLGTILLSIFAISVLPHLLNLIHTPLVVSHFAASYLNIIFCGLIATYFYNLYSALLRSIGNTKVALIVLIISMIINTLLDLLLVVVCGYGIEGAAIATVIAQTFSAILCFVYIQKKLPSLLFKKEDAKFDKCLLKKTASYSLISALHQCSLYIGKLLVQGAVNSMGTDMITAYTATTKIEGFANSFGSSGGEAISVFVAQNSGIGNQKRAKQGFLTGLMIMLSLAIILSCLMYFTATSGIQFMINTNTAAVVKNGKEYMQTISFFYPLCFAGSAFVGWYRGSGKVKIPVVGTILHLSIRVIISYLLIQQIGLMAVAVATGIGWISVVIFQSILFRLQK